MSFATVAQKATDPAFRARLAVAVTEQCRYTLGRAKGGSESDTQYAWMQALARSLLQQLPHAQHMDRIARLVLLPASWVDFNPDDDNALQGRVGEYFTLFSADAPPE